MAGGGLPSTGGQQSTQTSGTTTPTFYGIPQPPKREAATTPAAPAVPVASNPNQPVLYGNPAQATSNVPSYAQDALANMTQQLKGLPMQPQFAQQQPSWMPQLQQAQQAFQQSEAFKNYQTKMQELQNQFQSSPEYQQFNQQQESFRPQMQEWQQQQMQQMQHRFPPRRGGFPGIGYGRGFGGYPGMGQVMYGGSDDGGETPGFGTPSGSGGLAGLMGGFGFYR